MIPIDPPKDVQQLAEMAGGTINECVALPDGSGFATMTMPLPKDHWLTVPGDNVPPMSFRLGVAEHIVIQVFPNMGWPDRGVRATRNEVAEQIRAAAKYAIRASTLNGQENDFDPDAMVQNFIVGLLGYWTPTGFSADPAANPPAPEP